MQHPLSSDEFTSTLPHAIHPVHVHIHTQEYCALLAGLGVLAGIGPVAYLINAPLKR